VKTIRLDDYVVDVLLRDLVGHDHSAAAFVVYLFLWRRTLGGGRKRVRLSHREIALETGLSKSRAARTEDPAPAQPRYLHPQA